MDRRYINEKLVIVVGRAFCTALEKVNRRGFARSGVDQSAYAEHE